MTSATPSISDTTRFLIAGAKLIARDHLDVESEEPLIRTFENHETGHVRVLALFPESNWIVEVGNQHRGADFHGTQWGDYLEGDYDGVLFHYDEAYLEEEFDGDTEACLDWNSFDAQQYVFGTTYTPRYAE